jgi:hypothetical protein
MTFSCRPTDLPITTLLLVLALGGCEQRTQGFDVIPLREIGAVVDDSLGRPGKMAVVGTRLVVLDTSEPMVHIYQLPDVTRIGSFGRNGGGPGEFRSATEIHVDPTDDDAFWIFDQSLSRMTRFAFAEDPLPRPDHLLTLSGPEAGLFMQPVSLDDSTLVATGLFSRGRLAVARRDGSTVRMIGDLPAENGADIPVTVLQHAYIARLATSSDGSRIVLATRHADQIEVFESDGDRVVKIQGSFGFSPIFTVRQTAAGVSMATGDDLRFGYIDLTTTDGTIVALFSGRSRGEVPGRANFGDQIQIYDWVGNHRATYALPTRALSIAVDTLGMQLIAVVHDPEPSLLRFEIDRRILD